MHGEIQRLSFVFQVALQARYPFLKGVYVKCHDLTSPAEYVNATEQIPKRFFIIFYDLYHKFNVCSSLDLGAERSNLENFNLQ